MHLAQDDEMVHTLAPVDLISPKPLQPHLIEKFTI